MFSLVLILNLLSELDFFKNINVSTYFPLYLSLLNSVSHVFEMLPFIFLISTQFFFINIFKNNELDIFKYSGLKNIRILKILSLTTLLMGILSVILFYNFASNLKNIYFFFCEDNIHFDEIYNLFHYQTLYHNNHKTTL